MKKIVLDVLVGGSIAGAILFIVAACTGMQIKAATETFRDVLPVVTNPMTGVAGVAVDSFDAAVAAYLEAHPEKLNTKWGLEEWGAVLLSGVFGGGARRKTTDLVRAVLPHAVPPDPSKPA